MTFRPLVTITLVLVAFAAYGQTRYVSDELIITMRTGPSTQNAIVRNLPAGTRVEVLEENPDSGYVRVRTLDRGTEGWVLGQYLTSEPIAKDRLAAAERRLAAANERVSDLEQRLAAANSELESTHAELSQAQATGSDTAQQLADIKKTSADAIAIKEQNDSLHRRVNELDLEREQLAAENAKLASRADREWFVVGAAVLFGGIILGLVLPLLKRKRRSSW